MIKASRLATGNGVLNIVATATTLGEAIQKAYKDVKKVSF
ncbi:hypothetical protein FUSO4_00135 [Fusobacterium necrophorum DJ-1]|uniref:Uncharacterized protein n=1 Tax=Fusobacterium necrophorum DJ-2 TaxID=1441737 RepID=A0AB73C5A3_9FUSO|nr:hypothetical protein FUSO5_03685 [Fusobacterium necrophorum BFTR-1]KDE68566.1 hypothetical protein FUSO4_00135 [Fusobacterium necrophorum DJ-1]KDE69660.1 hypothetical protein FUSO7_11400 [Fusobacterium necrophorum BFTR-2]KDE73411.1 hypothetical protein FUSO8_01345 [Fusobacterium necrophorum DJ-2]